MKTITVIGLSFVGVIGLVYGASAINMITSPARIASQATSPTNVVGNYENFYNLKSGYESRVLQVKRMNTETMDKYTRVDRAGIIQKCVELALDYNSKSSMINRNFVKADDLPSTLNPELCEAK